MYHKHLAECFPPEDLPRLYFCNARECFYYDVLMNMDELVWTESWDREIQNLSPVPRCPSCHSYMESYE